MKPRVLYFIKSQDFIITQIIYFSSALLSVSSKTVAICLLFHIGYANLNFFFFGNLKLLEMFVCRDFLQVQFFRIFLIPLFYYIQKLIFMIQINLKTSNTSKDMLMNRHRHMYFCSFNVDMPGYDCSCGGRYDRGSQGLRGKGNLYMWHFVKINVHLMSRNVSKSFRQYFSSSCGW